MGGIEDVGCILQPFASGALLAVVEADGDPRQDGEELECGKAISGNTEHPVWSAHAYAA